MAMQVPSTTSTASSGADQEDVPKPPAHYAARADAGDETWIEDAIEDYLGVRPTGPQREICRAVAAHPKVLVVSANSVGKSYILAAITIVWLFCRYPAVSFATSGTERKMKRTYCKPVESLHGNARIPLPGKYKSRPERIEIDGDPEHFFEASSPKDSGELEGVHTAYTLSIIEEADKPDVDEDVIDAMRSLASDDRDRYIMIANPPEDETNSIYPYMDDHPSWKVLRFSTFDAHNVQVELGKLDAPTVDGVAGVSKLADDWVDYNASEWPGLQAALRMSAPKIDNEGNYAFRMDDRLEDNPDFRPELSRRWHRRRAGIMPPTGASVNRPYGVAEVKAAWKRGEAIAEDPTFDPGEPIASAVDVARSNDKTVLSTMYPDVIVVNYDEQGTDHQEQGAELIRILEEMPRHPVAVDFIGHGSAIHDQLSDALPDVGKFEAGSTACQETTYDRKWAEGNALLGDFLENGGAIQNGTLRKELLAGARELVFTEKFIGSRGEDGAEVYSLSSKDDIKDRLDHSPDYLDSGMMAAWAASDETEFEDDDESFLFTN